MDDHSQKLRDAEFKTLLRRLEESWKANDMNSVAIAASQRGGSANPDIELSEISASMGDGNRLPRSRSNEKTPP